MDGWHVLEICLTLIVLFMLPSPYASRGRRVRFVTHLATRGPEAALVLAIVFTLIEAFLAVSGIVAHEPGLFLFAAIAAAVAVGFLMRKVCTWSWTARTRRTGANPYRPRSLCGMLCR
jgi:hypothetical protein